MTFLSKALLYVAVASNRKIVRKVQRVVTQGALVHFHLACGHLITEHASGSADKLPPEIECWACEEEEAKSSLFEKRLKDRLR